MPSDEDEMLSDAMFQEPNDYFQPEKPHTYTDYALLSGQKLRLRLVGHNPLWVVYLHMTDTPNPSTKLIQSLLRVTISGTAAKSSLPTSNIMHPT